MFKPSLLTILTTGLLLSLLLFSCQDKKETAVILLSPFDLYITGKTNGVVVIDVTCHSPFDLKKLSVKSRIDQGFSFVELDSSISGKNFYMQYEYLVPQLDDTTNIFLEFTLLDASDEKVTNFKYIVAIPSATYLKETAGHVLHSGNSGEQNGYNLATGTPLFSHLSDSINVHIADTSNNEVLLKRWISPAGLKFVRFNGFDYANCTNLTAKNAFTSGTKYEYITMIEEGDIYITNIRLNNTQMIYPVIKITDIIDGSGSTTDRYVFSIKK